MSNSRLEHLQKLLADTPQKDYPYQSRIHSLHSYNKEHAYCYVKREDELGCGISGSKIRKYRTLIPYLLQQAIQEVVVIGSAYSNHVLGISQLLIENQLKGTYFLKGNPERSKTGNALLTTLFTQKNEIHWISKIEWKNVNLLASDYAQKQSHKVFVLPEGGSCEAALLGSLTLPLDILRNEQENSLEFDHIFIDAGTSLMASALSLVFNWLQRHTQIHIVLMAEQQEAFMHKLMEYQLLFHHLIQIKTLFPENFCLYRPSLKKFGQVNSSLFQFIANLAHTEGFLTDPIYSAKLFLESKKIIQEKALKGNILIIHSGGTLSLSGFTEHLLKSL